MERVNNESGKPIAISTNFTSSPLLAMWLVDLRILRSDLSGAGWSLWDPSGTNQIFPDGSRTEMGGKVNLQRDFKEVAGDGTSWVINVFFTPNAVEMANPNATVQATYEDVERKGAMLLLPVDLAKNVTFSVQVKVRLYYDDSVVGARRLHARQGTVDPVPVEEVTFTVPTVFVNVTGNVTTPNTDGTTGSGNGSSPTTPVLLLNFNPKTISMIAVLGAILFSGIVSAMCIGCNEKRKKADVDLLPCETEVGWGREMSGRW